MHTHVALVSCILNQYGHKTPWWCRRCGVESSRLHGTRIRSFSARHQHTAHRTRARIKNQTGMQLSLPLRFLFWLSLGFDCDHIQNLDCSHVICASPKFSTGEIVHASTCQICKFGQVASLTQTDNGGYREIPSVFCIADSTLRRLQNMPIHGYCCENLLLATSMLHTLFEKL
jgi:hypothetical protein